MASFLYMRNRHGSLGQCAVFKETNRQLSQVGNDFGTTETTADTSHRCTNRVIHWGNDLLAINRDRIYRYDGLAGGSGGTGEWEVFHIFQNWQAPGGTHDAYQMGWTPASINGSGVLLTAYPDISNINHIRTVFIDKSFNVWEAPVSANASYSNNQNHNLFVSPIAMNNKFMYQAKTFAQYYFQYDLINHVIQRRTPQFYDGSAGPGAGQNCAYKDWYILLGQQDSDNAGIPGNPPGNNDDIGLWKTQESDAAIALGSVNAGIGNHDVGLDGCYANIEIDGKIYVVGRNQSVYKMWEVELDDDANFIGSTDVSSRLPAGLPAPTLNSFAMWRVDVETNGPGSPVYELEICTGGNNPRLLYTWNTAPTGNSWTPRGSSMTGGQYTWVERATGGPGPFMWSGVGSINVSYPKLSLSNDKLGVDAEFEIYGPPGVSGLALELYFGKGVEQTRNRGTIRSTSLGAINSNRVEDLSTGDKVTVSWAAVKDGLTSADKAKIHARIYKV